MNRIGVFYDNGSGVPEDDAEAVYWYQRAADLGNLDGQNNLGYMYEVGLGVSQDLGPGGEVVSPRRRWPASRWPSPIWA